MWVLGCVVYSFVEIIIILTNHMRSEYYNGYDHKDTQHICADSPIGNYDDWMKKMHICMLVWKQWQMKYAIFHGI